MNLFKMGKMFAGGILFCEDCLKKQIAQKTNDKDAFEKSIKSGAYKKVDEGKCMLCDNAAKYKVDLKDAMKAIKRTQN